MKNHHSFDMDHDASPLSPHSARLVEVSLYAAMP